MKRLYTVLVCCAVSMMIPTQSKALGSTGVLLLGAGAFFVGSQAGKQWEREDPRRARPIVVQPEYQPSNVPVNNGYSQSPSGRYYYQPTMYSYEPQRVIIRDSY